MNGWVDGSGRALLRIALRAGTASPSTDLEAWIDTGFTGELSLPQAAIASLGLSQSGTVTAALADGSTVVMSTYTCLLNWFGQEMSIEVVASGGRFALLGVGLLTKHKLTIDYSSRALRVD